MNLLSKFVTELAASSLAVELKQEGFEGLYNLRKMKPCDAYYLSIPILFDEKDVDAEIMIELPEDDHSTVAVWGLIDLHETGLLIDNHDLAFFFNSERSPVNAMKILNDIYKTLDRVTVDSSNVAKCAKKFNGNNIEVFIDKLIKVTSSAVEFNKLNNIKHKAA